MQTFAQRIEEAAMNAHMKALPNMASKAEVCESIQEVVNELWEMPMNKAVKYIEESYSHTGHLALAVRMFKKQNV